ncbi:SpoIIE family protein phosphatase [Micromonospora sp. WMMD1128]|uniref:SpoIIE family protein phosphatase n=1 Tax=Micromonospora sp. WMMD1128 TaxID=3015150 RepID=UPI00248ADC98|nr:SpoIIE family protein phosphatase [Micromonospora sp. WMMD1128]WBB75395.1 SpoIIE family protein phosphatase [Micromonospora sp. WMMD1128]
MNVTPPDDPRWPDTVAATGGRAGAVITAYDWSGTPLGPIEGWPQSLRTALALCLRSPGPAVLWWGDGPVPLPNDAYRRLLGPGREVAPDRPAARAWPGDWDALVPLLARRDAGTSPDVRVRHARDGDRWFTFTHSPVTDESGRPAGVLSVGAETTARVVGERRLRLLVALGAALADAADPEEVARRAVDTLGGAASMPFVRLHLATPGGPRLAATAGAEVPPVGDLPLAEVLADGAPRLVPPHLAGGRADAPVVAVLPVPDPGAAAPAGVLVVGLDPHRAVDADHRAFVGLLAGQVGVALAAARARRRRSTDRAGPDAAVTVDTGDRRTAFVAAVTRDVSDRQRALRRAEALARLAGALSSARGREAIVEVLTTVAPDVVDAAALRVAVALPGRTVLDVTGGDAPPGPLPLDTDAPLARAVRDNAVLPVTGADGRTTGLCLPLRYGDGVALGALEVRWADPVSDDDALHNLLDAVAALCSQALQRAELIGSAQAMAVFAARLSVTRSTAEAIEVILDAPTTVFGAELPGLAMRDEGRRVRLWYHDDVPGTLAAAFHDLGVDDPRPLVRALRDGTRIVLRDRAEFAARFPGLPDPVGAHGLVTTVALPLFGAERRPIAALGFGWRRERPLRDTDLASLNTVADLCEQTLERVRLAAAEHNLVTRLAGRLRSSSLTPPKGLEVATRYRPAMSGLHLGGDWYDLVRQDGDRLAVVVGDVVGHQVEAAADMAQLRTMLNTLIRLGVPLAEVFLRLTELLGVGFLGTCLIAVVDPVAGTAQVARAGHPHPVLLPAGQPPRAVPTAHALPLGMVDAPMTVATIPFAPGDVLVAYTDGLVERRGRPYDEGVAALHRTLAAVRDEPAEAIADALLHDLAGSEDDQALVVLRHRR